MSIVRRPNPNAATATATAATASPSPAPSPAQGTPPWMPAPTPPHRPTITSTTATGDSGGGGGNSVHGNGTTVNSSTVVTAEYLVRLHAALDARLAPLKTTVFAQAYLYDATQSPPCARWPSTEYYAHNWDAADRHLVGVPRTDGWTFTPPPIGWDRELGLVYVAKNLIGNGKSGWWEDGSNYRGEDMSAVGKYSGGLLRLDERFERRFGDADPPTGPNVDPTYWAPPGTAGAAMARNPSSAAAAPVAAAAPPLPPPVLLSPPRISRARALALCESLARFRLPDLAPPVPPLAPPQTAAVTTDPSSRPIRARDLVVSAAPVGWTAPCAVSLRLPEGFDWMRDVVVGTSSSAVTEETTVSVKSAASGVATDRPVSVRNRHREGGADATDGARPSSRTANAADRWSRSRSRSRSRDWQQSSKRTAAVGGSSRDQRDRGGAPGTTSASSRAAAPRRGRSRSLSRSRSRSRSPHRSSWRHSSDRTRRQHYSSSRQPPQQPQGQSRRRRRRSRTSSSSSSGTESSSDGGNRRSVSRSRSRSWSRGRSRSSATTAATAAADDRVRDRGGGGAGLPPMPGGARPTRGAVDPSIGSSAVGGGDPVRRPYPGSVSGATGHGRSPAALPMYPLSSPPPPPPPVVAAYAGVGPSANVAAWAVGVDAAVVGPLGGVDRSLHLAAAAAAAAMGSGGGGGSRRRYRAPDDPPSSPESGQVTPS
ncbi:hypothetical protein BC828DRAFT_402615 [Blastocladiella britannica]|nr:hypothetical protein BC828DRAFT_402615 [Blastocladiella britannica]